MARGETENVKPLSGEKKGRLFTEHVELEVPKL